MEFLDVNKCTSVLDARIQAYLANNSGNGVMAIIQVGDNPISESYIRLKIKYCSKFGITAQLFKIESTLPDADIIKKVQEIFARSEVLGGIIQLPLPRSSLNSILNLIPLEKDIDMLSSNSWIQYDAGKLGIKSPVVLAFRTFVDTFSIDIHNMTVEVIGRGKLVGVPIEKYLLSMGVKPLFLDDYISGDRIDADLLVTSTGVPNLLKGENVTSGCSIVDFGSSIINGKTVGDLDLSSRLSHLNYISPSPGGMGPLVLRYLIMNYLGLGYSSQDFQLSQ